MNLRQLRESRNLSRADLARLTTLDVSTIAILENGGVRDPRTVTVKALSRALTYTTDEIAAAIERSYLGKRAIA